jgi:hypothetical protein
MPLKLRSMPLTTFVMSTLILILLSSVAGAQDRPGFPAIVVEPDSLAFGRMDQLQVKTQTVTIKNIGGAELVLSNIETTCGCTAAVPDVDVLQPGQSTELVVTFDSKNFTGPQHKFIRIHSNDAAEAILTIPVTSYVFAPLVFIPQWKVVGFGAGRTTELNDQTIRVVAQEAETLDLEITRVNSQLFDVHFEPSSPDTPNRLVVTFSIKEDAPPGVFREIISFKTNLAEAPTFDIEATGDIHADVSLFPERHNFRYVTRGQELNRVFFLKKPRSMPMKIAKATLDLPGFEVSKVELSEHTGHFEISITGIPVEISDQRAQEAKGRMRGTLRVITDNADLPVFESTIMYMLKL